MKELKKVLSTYCNNCHISIIGGNTVCATIFGGYNRRTKMLHRVQKMRKLYRDYDIRMNFINTTTKTSDRL